MKRAVTLLIACLFPFLGLVFAQDVAPNEHLVVEGVPKIPQAIADAVDRYNNYRYATLASWHPTRREMLIATRFPTCRRSIP